MSSKQANQDGTPDPAVAIDSTMTNEELELVANYKPPQQYDGDWIDYTRDSDLSAFKRSLPSSIQQIIEWGYALRKRQVLEFDFAAFRKNLMYQYRKYKGDKKALKRIYFDYNPEGRTDERYEYQQTAEYEVRYAMIFGERHATVIHHLFGLLDGSRFGWIVYFFRGNEKNQIWCTVLKMLKMFIANDIIDANDALYASSLGQSIFDQILYLTHSINAYDKDCSEEVMDLVVDLITICSQKQSFLQRPSVMTVFLSLSDKDMLDDSYCLNFTDEDMYVPRNSTQGLPANQKLCNRHKVIEKLLLRGLAPFQFMHEEDQGKRMKYEAAFIRALLAKQTKLCKFEEVASDHKLRLISLSLSAPLVLLPYIRRVREKWKRTISVGIREAGHVENESLSDSVADTVSLYLCGQFEEWYPEPWMREDRNMKALVFLNHLVHFEIDDVFMQEYKEKYSDVEFLHFVVTNFLVGFSRFLGECRNVEFVRNLIDSYNTKYKYPLQNGIYLILDEIDRYLWLDEIRKRLKPLAQHFAGVYGDEFNHRVLPANVSHICVCQVKSNRKCRACHIFVCFECGCGGPKEYYCVNYPSKHCKLKQKYITFCWGCGHDDDNRPTCNCQTEFVARDEE